eukprot:830230-Prymnesium_polylepis.1
MARIVRFRRRPRRSPPRRGGMPHLRASIGTRPPCTARTTPIRRPVGGTLVGRAGRPGRPATA